MLAYALGGRAAEELVFHEPTTGASNDIEKATATARAMVMTYGMSEKLGPLKFGRGEGEVFLGRDLGHERDFSEEVASQIDDEVRGLIERAHNEAWEILVKYRDVLDDLVLKLLDKETLTKADLTEIFSSVDKRPFRNFASTRKPPANRPPVLTPGEIAKLGPEEIAALGDGNGSPTAPSPTAHGPTARGPAPPRARGPTRPRSRRRRGAPPGSPPTAAAGRRLGRPADRTAHGAGAGGAWAMPGRRRRQRHSGLLQRRRSTLRHRGRDRPRPRAGRAGRRPRRRRRGVDPARRGPRRRRRGDPPRGPGRARARRGRRSGQHRHDAPGDRRGRAGGRRGHGQRRLRRRGRPRSAPTGRGCRCAVRRHALAGSQRRACNSTRTTPMSSPR